MPGDAGRHPPPACWQVPVTSQWLAGRAAGPMYQPASVVPWSRVTDPAGSVPPGRQAPMGVGAGRDGRRAGGLLQATDAQLPPGRD